MRFLPHSAAGLLALALLAAAPVARAEVPTPDELSALKHAYEDHPDDDDLRARYGDALFRSGEALQSLRVLNPGREATRRWVVELRRDAAAYLETEQYDAARRALRDAIALDPDDASLYQRLAEAYAAARRAGITLEGDPVAADPESAAPAAEPQPAPAPEPQPGPPPATAQQPSAEPLARELFAPLWAELPARLRELRELRAAPLAPHLRRAFGLAAAALVL